MERKVSLKYEKEDEVKLTKEIEEVTKSCLTVRNEVKNLKEEMERKIKESDKKEKEVDEKHTREIEELTKTYIHDGTWTEVVKS